MQTYWITCLLIPSEFLAKIERRRPTFKTYLWYVSWWRSFRLRSGSAAWLIVKGQVLSPSRLTSNWGWFENDSCGNGVESAWRSGVVKMDPILKDHATQQTVSLDPIGYRTKEPRHTWIDLRFGWIYMQRIKADVESLQGIWFWLIVSVQWFIFE